MKTQAPVEAIVKDLKNLTHDAEDLVTAAGTDVGAGALEARRRFASAVESAREGCLDLQEKARNGARATDKLIRHNPYQTAGIAFAAGLLIGILATLRRS